MMKRALATLLVWLMAAPAYAGTITWVNDGADGWGAGDDWDADNINLIETAVDDNARDTHYYVVDDGSLSQADIHAAITAACTQVGNIQSNCREIVLPRGTFTLTGTAYLTDDGNDGPDAATGEGVWGLKLRGAGGAYIQTPFTSSSTEHCATTLIWDGASALPMIWVHGGRNVHISDLCLVLDGDQDGTTGTPPASHGIVVTSNSGEISEGVVIEGVDIYGFSSSWANNATYTSTCVALLPSDFSGDPPYATSTQVDHFVMRSSRLQCHNLFLGANGSSGTNGVTLMNVSGGYTGYGIWAESTDLQVYSGKYVTKQAYGASTDEGTSCTNSEAWIKIGSTSSDQAKIVSVIGATAEGNCGEAIATVDATTAADQRDSTTTLVNTSINWGAAGEDHVINYTHHGAFTMVGGFLGIRNSENYTTGSREFISMLPDTRTADTLAVRLMAANLDSWTTGSFQVETNSQVDLIRTEELSDNAITNAKMADDAIGAAEMADADHGDVAWSGGVASVQAGTATTAGALASNGANCTAGSYPLGVDASGAVESCTDATTEIDAVVATKSAATSTDNAVPKFDSTAGDVQNSGVLIDDSNNLTVPGSITSGTSGASCLILRDSDDGGDSACAVLNGTFSCETDTNGVCGDAT